MSAIDVDVLAELLDAKDDDGEWLLTDLERNAVRAAVTVMRGYPDQQPLTERRSIRFFVPGDPRPKGDLRSGTGSNGKPFMYDAESHRLRKWMRAIEAEAAKHTGAWSKQIPVVVKLSFVMPATAKHHVGWCAVAPDIDKLERAVLDALHTGKHKVYVSDAQVVQVIKAKRWGHKPGVWITVADAGPAYDLRTPVTVDQTGVTTP